MEHQIYHIPASIMNRHQPDYPQTGDTIARAKACADEERRRPQSLDELDRMVKLHGAERVHKWLRNVAVLNGERIPCDGPLAS